MEYGSIEEERNLSYYELRRMARAKDEVEKLLNQREAYFESLYDDVIYCSVTIDPLAPGNGNPNTDVQAMRIIDSKAAYDERIMKLKESYGQWRGYLQSFNKDEADLLIRYFEDDIPIPIITIDKLVLKAHRQHESIESGREYAKDREVNEKYVEHLKTLRMNARKPKGLKVLQGGRLIEQQA